MFALPIFLEERTDCRRWREKGGERVAAVDKIEDQRKPEDFIGHRNITRQVLSAHMCLTSVFGMAASPSAAGGRISEGAACAAVGK